MQQYSDLHEGLHEIINQDAAARIAHLHIDRWIDYPRALEALATRRPK
mgnify:CR=1 FL=1